MNPPSLTFLNLLDVTAIGCLAQPSLFDEAARAGVATCALAGSSCPASPIARGLGKDAHACPPMLDPAGRVSFFDSLFMAKNFGPEQVPPSIPETGSDRE